MSSSYDQKKAVSSCSDTILEIYRQGIKGREDELFVKKLIENERHPFHNDSVSFMPRISDPLAATIATHLNSGGYQDQGLEIPDFREALNRYSSPHTQRLSAHPWDYVPQTPTRFNLRELIHDDTNSVIDAVAQNSLMQQVSQEALLDAVKHQADIEKQNQSNLSSEYNGQSSPNLSRELGTKLLSAVAQNSFGLDKNYSTASELLSAITHKIADNTFNAANSPEGLRSNYMAGDANATSLSYA